MTIKIALFLLINLFGHGITFSQNVVNNLTDLEENLTQKIFEKTKDLSNETQLSIVLIKNGISRFYGMIKQNDTIRNIENKDKVFEIGSISKTFTATLLADAILERKIKQTDDINKFYPYAFKDDVRITFESLSNHTPDWEKIPLICNFQSFWQTVQKQSGKILFRNTATLN